MVPARKKTTAAMALDALEFIAQEFLFACTFDDNPQVSDSNKKKKNRSSKRRKKGQQPQANRQADSGGNVEQMDPLESYTQNPAIAPLSDEALEYVLKNIDKLKSLQETEVLEEFLEQQINARDALRRQRQPQGNFLLNERGFFENADLSGETPYMTASPAVLGDYRNKSLLDEDDSRQLTYTSSEGIRSIFAVDTRETDSISEITDEYERRESREIENIVLPESDFELVAEEEKRTDSERDDSEKGASELDNSELIIKERPTNPIDPTMLFKDKRLTRSGLEKFISALEERQKVNEERIRAIREARSNRGSVHSPQTGTVRGGTDKVGTYRHARQPADGDESPTLPKMSGDNLGTKLGSTFWSTQHEDSKDNSSEENQHLSKYEQVKERRRVLERTRELLEINRKKQVTREEKLQHRLDLEDTKQALERITILGHGRGLPRPSDAEESREDSEDQVRNSMLGLATRRHRTPAERKREMNARVQKEFREMLHEQVRVEELNKTRGDKSSPRRYIERTRLPRAESGEDLRDDDTSAMLAELIEENL